MYKKIFLTALCFLAITKTSLAQEVNHCIDAPAGTWVPNPEGCEYFFWCSGDDNGQAGSCSGGRWFDFLNQNCNWPDVVECEFAPIYPPPIEINCPANGIARFSHPFSCRKYVICVNGRQFDRECEQGLHFNYLMEECVPVDVAQCYIDYNLCPLADDIWSPFVFGSPRDCSVFYNCISRNIIPRRCAPGLHFNAERLACDFPHNVDCTPTLNPDEFLPEIIEMDCEQNEFLIFHPHPQSCEHYFMCVNGESTLRFCAPGLHFDTRFDRCDDPQHVQCVIGQELIVPTKRVVPNPVHIQ